MRKTLSLLSLAFVTFFTACNKNDDPKPSDPVDAIIKVEVTHVSADLENYQETNTIQTVGASSISVSGTTWDEILTPSPDVKWFIKQQDVKATNTYVTSSKVKILTYATGISSKTTPTVPLHTTIKIYKDDKLVITKNYTTLESITNISLPSEEI